jgi:hypothetical protein
VGEESIRDGLGRVEDQVRQLREERARARSIKEAAIASAASHGNDESSMVAAQAAVDGLKAVEERLEKVGNEQTDLLKKLGDQEAGVAGWSSPRRDGWEYCSTTLDLSSGVLRADVMAASLFTPSISPAARTIRATPTVTVPTDNRYMFPVFEQRPFGDAADVVTTDFEVSTTEAPVSGIEIPVATDTSKAEIDATISLATPTAKVFAVIANGVPARIFDSQPALRDFLSGEMKRHLEVAFDDHVIAAIEGASPPSGSTGSDLIAKVRNAIASHRALGSVPTHLALSPTDAAALDLATDDGGYVFSVDREGSGSPVWSVLVREADVAAPTLIDPQRLGLTYLGNAATMVDPYGANMRQNLVSVRVESESVFHLRNPAGAYQIV